MLYSDWGEKIFHRSVHRVDSCFRVLCTTLHLLLSYRKLLLFQLFPNYSNHKDSTVRVPGRLGMQLII